MLKLRELCKWGF